MLTLYWVNWVCSLIISTPHYVDLEMYESVTISPPGTWNSDPIKVAAVRGENESTTYKWKQIESPSKCYENNDNGFALKTRLILIEKKYWIVWNLLIVAW